MKVGEVNMRSRAGGHVALLGDSIFDNAAYVHGAPDVVNHLQPLLPDGWRATLCAVDGATTANLETQLARMPDDVTQLIISIGGNDALTSFDLLSMPAATSLQVLDAFDTRVGVFEHRYRAAITAAVKRQPHTTVCTIYNGALDAELARAARVGLTLFNDVIVRTAVDLNLSVLDLRTVCTDAADYVNLIEPSARGGQKIARAIANLLRVDDMPHARIWGAPQTSASPPDVPGERQ
jgi:hypothetical protein